MPFHANFDSPLYDGVRRCTSAPLRPKSVEQAGRPDPHAGQRTPRRAAAARHLRPDPGLRRHRRGLGGVRIGRSASRTGAPTCWPPSTRAAWRKPGSGVEVANARPGYLELSDAGRGSAGAPTAPTARCRSSTPAQLPAARRFGVHRHRGRRPDARCLHRRHRDGAEDRRPRAVGAQSATRSIGRGARRPRRQRSGGPRGDDPLLRSRAVVRPHRAHSRSTIHGTTIKPGQRIITLLASAARDEREYPNPDEFIWDRPIERLLAFGRGQHFCLGVHLARLEITHHGARSGSSGCPTSGSSPRPRRGRRRASSGAGTISRWRSDDVVVSARRAVHLRTTRTAGQVTGNALAKARFCCGSWPRASAVATCPASAAPRASCPATPAPAPPRWTASRSTRSSAR